MPASRRPKSDVQTDLYTQIEDRDWKAPEVLPVLDDRFKRIAFDSEWDGTDVHGSSKVVGFSTSLEDGRDFYFPFGHRGGGNLDKELCLRWARTELKGKILVMAEAKGDIEMMRKEKVDFEELGCSIREIQFGAALLDDTRRSFKLEDMGQDFLGQGKDELDRARIWEYPASRVGPYACRDTRITLEVDDYLTPRIDAEGMSACWQLENDIIYATLDMERNGTRLDVPKLDRWILETGRMSARIHHELLERYNRRINPNSNVDVAWLFEHEGQGYPRTEPSPAYPNGQPSFTDEFLKTLDYDYVALIRGAKTIDSIRSKYLVKYKRAIRNGILRFKLHQMKGDDYGTISGRYSSSKPNIQQVYAAKKQKKKIGSIMTHPLLELIFKDFVEKEFIIRELFIPLEGCEWCKADAMQIEFRLFAHYANDPAILAEYEKNPLVDYHVVTQELVRTAIELDRDDAKTYNFGRVYGMGRDKNAAQLGLSRTEADKLYDAYDKLLPAVGKLMRKVMDIAKKRGYVHTYMGRRARFDDGSRGIHSALNRVLQGTAAEVLKMKLKHVYRERKTVGIEALHMVVHDEFDSSIKPGYAKRYQELLNTQDFTFRVPILWDVSTGPNWSQQKKAA
jgi:DNA polymerase I-like protein with 3'-5' exonuclease and polymerase domains